MTATEPAICSSPIEASVPSSEQARETTPWLLCCLCVLIPVLPTYVIPPGALKGNGAPARMIALIMFGLVVMGFLLVRRTSQQRRINPGAVIVLLYFALWLTTYGVGLLSNDDYTTSSNKTRALVGLVAHVGVALYVIARVQTARQRNVVLGCLAVGLTFACLVGLLQAVASLDLRLLLQPPGFIVNPDINILQLSFKRQGVNRVTATSQHPIEFSVLAAVTIPLTLHFARNATTTRVRLLSSAASVVALLALPAAVSRSGIISLTAALLVYMFAFKIRPIIVALSTLIVAITGYMIVFPTIANALWSTITGSTEDASVESRIEDYARVSESFRQHPIFGLGLGGSVPTEFGYLDNEWMGAIVQGGVIGLAAMALISFGAIFGIAAAIRTAASSRERDQAYMLGAMAAGILASSFTFDLFGFEQTTVIFFIVFSLLWSGFNVPLPEPDDSKISLIG